MISQIHLPCLIFFSAFKSWNLFHGTLWVLHTLSVLACSVNWFIRPTSTWDSPLHIFPCLHSPYQAESGFLYVYNTYTHSTHHTVLWLSSLFYLGFYQFFVTIKIVHREVTEKCQINRNLNTTGNNEHFNKSKSIIGLQSKNAHSKSSVDQIAEYSMLLTLHEKSPFRALHLCLLLNNILENQVERWKFPYIYVKDLGCRVK